MATPEDLRPVHFRLTRQAIDVTNTAQRRCKVNRNVFIEAVLTLRGHDLINDPDVIALARSIDAQRRDRTTRHKGVTRG